ncbi:MAG: ribosome biogenesis GTPase Der [Betaproteobacteria bacterium]|jgi:GTP-binding protein|nr:ribosome biogenesis GTPase Der [Betaproteobacteria bacterium]
MKPTIVLVGRPNVGKSTLFNRLTRSRAAIVADMPGLTRDRHYGEGRLGDRPFIVVDTGGLEPVAKDGIFSEMAKQALAALAEADIAIFIVDGRAGLTPQDRRITEQLRASQSRVVLAVNKVEGMDPDIAVAEFHELGLGSPHAISAAHGEGIAAMLDAALAQVSVAGESEAEEEAEPEGVPRVAIVGRPNVGKSTLINALLGEERVIAFDEPGTTRDPIQVRFRRGDRDYVLIDTAGLRRRGRVFETVEKFSVIKTLQAIDSANVVILLLDAGQSIADQDAHIASFIVERGRAVVVAINKWDSLDDYGREQAKRQLRNRLGFMQFARLHYISALRGQGLTALMHSVSDAFAAAYAKLSTPRLTRTLIQAVAKQAPPRSGMVRPKLRYAHQGGKNPPIIVIHGNSLDAVTPGYRRYLEGSFRAAFALEGTPLRIEFRTGRNPFAARGSNGR